MFNVAEELTGKRFGGGAKTFSGESGLDKFISIVNDFDEKTVQKLIKKHS